MRGRTTSARTEHPSPVRAWVGMLCLVAAQSACTAEPLVITIPERDYEQGFWSVYFRSVLELALDATLETHGPYTLEVWNVSTKRQERELYELQHHGELDVAWSMTSRERETELLPVRVPLVKGLLGYRIAFVRAEDLEAFRRVRSREDLRAYVAGQGLGWPDAALLRANGLPVMEGRSFEGLFDMLRRGRFDYFPRGITEVWEEAETFAGDDLVVDDHLLVHYPAAVYFFVRRDNPGLAERLKAGLLRAMQDGRFNRLFTATKREALRRASLDGRTLIRLHNPLLPEETPLDNDAFWFHLGPR